MRREYGRDHYNRSRVSTSNMVYSYKSSENIKTCATLSW
nr:MAG TPA: hypothetical protein [Caudoviricetes sp.]DAS18771.1 MAG TPA: hypothetical protein [Caudoviricetes sp.]